jgi:hypothetical protein
LPEVVEPARFLPFGAVREILNAAEDQALPAAWRSCYNASAHGAHKQRDNMAFFSGAGF